MEATGCVCVCLYMYDGQSLKNPDTPFTPTPTTPKKQVVQQLIKFKRVRRPYVGLAFRLVNVETGQLDEATGRPARALGMYILEVKPGSPAERGGLQEGDVVVEIDGAPVRGLGDITDRIGLEPERTFKVKVLRHGQGKPLLLSVTSVADERIF